MRVIIDLSNEQTEALAKLTDKYDLSPAALVCVAINDYLARRADEDEQQAFGLWRERGGDGLVYQQTLRDEWT